MHPGTASLGATLEVESGPPVPDPAWMSQISAARKTLPAASPEAVFTVSVSGRQLVLHAAGIAASPDASIAFYPDASDSISLSASQEALLRPRRLRPAPGACRCRAAPGSAAGRSGCRQGRECSGSVGRCASGGALGASKRRVCGSARSPAGASPCMCRRRDLEPYALRAARDFAQGAFARSPGSGKERPCSRERAALFRRRAALLLGHGSHTCRRARGRQAARMGLPASRCRSGSGCRGAFLSDRLELLRSFPDRDLTHTPGRERHAGRERGGILPERPVRGRCRHPVHGPVHGRRDRLRVVEAPAR